MDDINKEFNHDFNNEAKLTDEHIRLQNKYTKLYGPRTVVLTQNGKFYEAYAYEEGKELLTLVSKCLNYSLVKRNNKLPPGPSNCYFCGFQIIFLEKCLELLINEGFTVIIFEQYQTKPDVFERKFQGVYSRGTYISNSKTFSSNYTLIVYIEEVKQRHFRHLLALGITIIDVNTGKLIVHEFCSSKEDERFGLDELIRIIQSYNPAEMIFYLNPVDTTDIINSGKTVESIKQYLDLKNYNHEFYIYTASGQSKDNNHSHDPFGLLTPAMFKLEAQNEYLSQIFDLKHLSRHVKIYRKMSPIEIIDLEQKPCALISLLISLKFISNHNPILVKRLELPSIYEHSKHLILGNNAIQQLNVIDSNGLETQQKKKESLLQILDKTCTNMGKRFLRQSLINPLSRNNREVIQKRYDIIEELHKDQLYESLQINLQGMYDIEKLHRKMATQTMTPYDFYTLDLSYKAFNQIYQTLKDKKKISQVLKLLNEETIQNFKEFSAQYTKIINFEEAQKYNNFEDIKSSIFYEGHYQEIDQIEDTIKSFNKCSQQLVKYFSGLISKNSKAVKGKVIDLSFDDQGYYFETTKTRYETLKKSLKTEPQSIELKGCQFTLDTSSIDKIKSNSKTKVRFSNKAFTKLGNKVISCLYKLSGLTRTYFIDTISQLYNKYSIMLYKLSNIIAELDFLVSGAQVAHSYSYCKPTLVEDETSSIVVQKLRHPIVERLCVENEFVPNDVNLRAGGILLFGPNSGGKSIYMKSIGLAIIMAQIGYYVPATQFSYSPYTAIYARITGNDNMFKGESSFDLEMIELNSIITRTNLSNQAKTTLVIGDEICRGTEGSSGICLVGSALVHLSESYCSFIFASHLHKLTEMEEIKSLPNLKFCHFSVERSLDQHDCLIYTRKLCEGSGPSVYGIEIAKYRINHPQFISRAESFRQKYINDQNLSSIPVKKSKYNSHLLLTCCAICYYKPNYDRDKELETHHINFQRDCDSCGKIKDKPHLFKNNLYNLVVLCHKCHERVHQNFIKIDGYHDTSIGPLLKYKIDYFKF
jgi:DNA mismatch repair protein MutS